LGSPGYLRPHDPGFWPIHRFQGSDRRARRPWPTRRGRRRRPQGSPCQSKRVGLRARPRSRWRRRSWVGKSFPAEPALPRGGLRGERWPGRRGRRGRQGRSGRRCRREVTPLLHRASGSPGSERRERSAR
jgi:hypothetical protein